MTLSVCLASRNRAQVCAECKKASCPHAKEHAPAEKENLAASAPAVAGRSGPSRASAASPEGARALVLAPSCEGVDARAVIETLRAVADAGEAVPWHELPAKLSAPPGTPPIDWAEVEPVEDEDEPRPAAALPPPFVPGDVALPSADFSAHGSYELMLTAEEPAVEAEPAVFAVPPPPPGVPGPFSAPAAADERPRGRKRPAAALAGGPRKSRAGLTLEEIRARNRGYAKTYREKKKQEKLAAMRA